MRTIHIWAIRHRVERLHVASRGLSSEDLVWILREGRQRVQEQVARGEYVRPTPEESRAAGRRLRAMLRGESVEMSGE